MNMATPGTSYVGLIKTILPFDNFEITKYLRKNNLNFKAALDKYDAYQNTDYVIFCNTN